MGFSLVNENTIRLIVENKVNVLSREKMNLVYEANKILTLFLLVVLTITLILQLIWTAIFFGLCLLFLNLFTFMASKHKYILEMTYLKDKKTLYIETALNDHILDFSKEPPKVRLFKETIFFENKNQAFTLYRDKSRELFFAEMLKDF